MVLLKSGMKGRYSGIANVTESCGGGDAGQPRGYQRTRWEQSAALIRVVMASGLAGSAGTQQQPRWKGSGRHSSPLGTTRGPALLSLFTPKLDRRFPGEFPAVFEQRHWLSGQQLPDRDLQLLTPAIPAGRTEVEHLAAITDPALLGRERWPLFASGGLGPSSGHLGRPATLARHVVGPALAAVGEVLAKGYGRLQGLGSRCPCRGL
jgi:hypothetical protein